MRLARRPDGDFHVLAEGSEEVHEAFDREGPGTVSHQSGNVWLLDAEYLSRFRLRDAALPDETVNSQSELCLQQFLFRVGEPEVGKNVTGALRGLGSPKGWFSRAVRLGCSSRQLSSAFACEVAQPRLNAAE